MSQQAIHFRDEKPLPRNGTEAAAKSNTPSSPPKPNTPLPIVRSPSSFALLKNTGNNSSSSNLFAETKAVSKQKYQNSRTATKLHKSAIFNACSSIADRHNTRSQRHINTPTSPIRGGRIGGGGGSVHTAHTSTSFNTARSFLQHDMQDETSVVSNRSSITQIKKYFGSSSRNDFYDRYQWLSKKQQIMNHGAQDMDQTIMFEDRRSLQLQASGVQEFPFCPKRPDQALSAEQVLLLSEYSDDSDHDDDQEGDDGGGEEDEDEEKGGDIPDITNSKFGQEHFNSDCASTIATNESSSFAPGLSLSLFPRNIEDDILSTTCPVPISPRSKYLVGCLKDNVNPRASLITRRKVSHELKMQHLGMGDRMGIVLAESVKDLPFIETINLSDNNLTDKSLCKIINSIITIESLTDLDLSENIIDGQAALALAKFLGSSNCKLQRLIMKSANIDDDECSMFVVSLKKNNSLRELDMSCNLLGVSENLNSVKPDLITGSEALADLLESNTCFISSLHLSWNMIRLDGAVTFATSIGVNAFLTHLDVSYNSLGEAGGEALGKALFTNKTLKTLFLDHNGLTSSSILALSVAMEEVMSLRQVRFDHNPIGDAGAQVLMQIPVATRGRVKLSTNKCNITIKYEKDAIFKLSHPADKYSLQLDDPYQRAVCIKLLKIVATNSLYILDYIEYKSPESKVFEPLRLKPSTYTVPESELEDEQVLTVQNLQNLQKATEDSKVAKKLFKDIDSDGSGGIDVDELNALMLALSMQIEREVLEVAFDQYDLAGAGVIELPEFLSFLHCQAQEAQEKISDILHYKILSSADSPGVKYVPPEKGIMRLSVMDSYTKKSSQNVMTQVDHSHVMEATEGQTENLPKLLLYSLNGSKLRLKQGLALVNTIMGETRNKPATLSKILPYMLDPTEARMLIGRVIQDSKADMARLKQIMGNALRPIIGMETGFYSLDLTDEMDRLCLQRLLQFSESVKVQRQTESIFSWHVGDLSQKGDWSCFRNDYIDGKPGVISAALFTPMPFEGTLHFDFSGGHPPGEDPLVITDVRVLNILFNLSLATKVEKHRYLKFMNALEEEARLNNKGDGRFKHNSSKKLSIAIKHCVSLFNNSLPQRQAEFEKSRQNEGCRISALHRETSDLCETDVRQMNAMSHVEESSDEDDDDEFDEERPRPNPVEKTGRVSIIRSNKAKGRKSIRAKAGGNVPVTPSPAISERKVSTRGGTSLFDSADKGFEHSVANSALFSEFMAGAGSSSASASTGGKFSRVQKTPLLRLSSNDRYVLDYGAKFRELMGDADTTTEAKCHRIYAAMDDIFGRVWIRCSQMAVIISAFQIGMTLKTQHFGSYRVETVVNLFNRIVDLHNFEVVLAVLTPYEVACVQCRIGLLHYFNPMKPEGFHTADLSNREERVLAKILAALSFVEPGENWIGETFRWEVGFDDVPGWELLRGWLADATMPHRGHMALQYSTECAALGCTEGGDPVVNFRKSLLHLVRIRALDYVYDDNLEDITEVSDEGDRNAMANIDLWSTFLSPPPLVDSASTNTGTTIVSTAAEDRGEF